jgi:septal ring factor EnvC (AmiA/AmiB activator)
LAAERDRNAQMTRQLEEVRHRMARIEAYTDELERTLKLASAEIWGQGTSTAQHLASAQRSLEDLRGELQRLNRSSSGERQQKDPASAR